MKEQELESVPLRLMEVSAQLSTEDVKQWKHLTLVMSVSPQEVLRPALYRKVRGFRHCCSKCGTKTNSNSIARELVRREEPQNQNLRTYRTRVIVRLPVSALNEGGNTGKLTLGRTGDEGPPRLVPLRKTVRSHFALCDSLGITSNCSCWKGRSACKWQRYSGSLKYIVPERKEVVCREDTLLEDSSVRLLVLLQQTKPGELSERMLKTIYKFLKRFE
nr:uncharacterized protein LOC129461968 [Symphalangus syndactylus]